MRMTRHTVPLVAAIFSYLALAAACGGGGGGGTPPPSPPANLAYAFDTTAYREGAAITPNTATVDGGAPTSFSASPALPTGLALDPVTGAISGTPAAEGPATQHVVTAMNAAGQTTATVTIAVWPAPFVSIAPGFTAETIHENPALTPVKHGKVVVAPAGDDRVFFTEVDTGDVRVIDPMNGLEATPFAHVDVRVGGHNGLLGLCLAPDFATSATPYVYVLACVNGSGMTVDRMQVLRYTAVGNVGTNETIVIDDLPVSAPSGINNGGEICFDLNGNLFVSIGDVNVPGNADADTSVSLAGKILRYDVSVVPAVAATGNPTAGDPEWCRGIRNTFGMAVHPTAGGLFGVDNGPAADDELNFLAAGKHAGWGGNPPGAQAIVPLRTWQTVIVPTGLCWHDGTTWGATYANSLFLTAYAEHTITRFAMSGATFVDIDSEEEFARLEDLAGANHPLAVCMAPDGSLYVATFTGIYRIVKL